MTGSKEKLEEEDIILPEWLAKKKGLGCRVRKWIKTGSTKNAIFIRTKGGEFTLPKSEITLVGG